jgi:hypothetical protein
MLPTGGKCNCEKKEIVKNKKAKKESSPIIDYVSQN